MKEISEKLSSLHVTTWTIVVLILWFGGIRVINGSLMVGDLVQSISHSLGTGDVDWLRQDTFSTVEIVSGIYIYVVEELDSPGGSPTGKTATGKFVVIK